LVVEDEKRLRTVLEKGLVAAGFKVIMACDGVRAIAELNTRAGQFSAVITDIRLGKGPDGWEVGRHARELVPAMPVVYVTGDSAHAWPSMGVSGSVLLSKPYGFAQLIATISTLLTETDAR
jgi:DNA-binding response OmpR family regulator